MRVTITAQSANVNAIDNLSLSSLTLFQMYRSQYSSNSLNKWNKKILEPF